MAQFRLKGGVALFLCPTATSTKNVFVCFDYCLIFPHRPDMFDDNFDSGLPHRQDLCEKCKKLGHCCRDFE